MKIRSLRVNGLGMLADTGIEEISDGLVLLEGPNGAGKSTFLEFVNSLLFGYPTGRGSNKFAETVGGLRGGVGMVEMKDGALLRWERGAPPPASGSLSVQRAGVAIPGEGLLGNATRDLYGSVFALSLDQLGQAITGDLQEAIEAAITGMGVRGLPRALKVTEAELKDLDRKVRDLVAELKAAEEELNRAKERTRQYDETLEQARRARTEAEQLSCELQPLQEAAANLARLQQAWPTWCEYEEARAAAEQLPDPSGFDPGAAQRLKMLQEAEASHLRSLQASEQELVACRSALAKLNLAPQVLMQSAAIEALGSSVQTVRECEIALPERLRDIEDSARQLRAHLAGLGPEWDEPRLEGFDSSMNTLAEAGRLTRAIQDARAKLTSEEAEWVARRRDLADATHDFEEAQTRKFNAATPPSPDELDRRQNAIEQVRSALVTEARLSLELETLERVSAPEAGSAAPDYRPWIMGCLIAVAMIGAGIASKVYWLGLVGLVVGFAAALLMRRPPEAAAPNTRADSEALRRERERARAAAQEICDREGWEVRSESDLTSIASAVQKLRNEAGELRALDQTLEDAKRRVKMLRDRSEEAAVRCSVAEEARNAATQAWYAWCGSHGYPEALEPDLVPEFERRVQLARSALDSLKKAQSERTLLESRKAAISARLSDVYVALGWEREGVGDADAMVGLVRSLKAAEAAEIEATAQEKEIAAIDRRQAQLNRELAATQAEISELLARYGASDHAEFDSAVKRLEEAISVERRRSGSQEKLKLIGGPGAGYELLVRELAGLEGGFELDEAAAQARLAAVEAEERSREANKLATQLERDVENLERGADLGSALARRAELQASVDSVRGRWLEGALAKSLLSEAKEKFQDQVQSSVFERASHYMRELTDGVSGSVRKEGDGYVVLDKDGRSRTLAQLNRSHSERLLMAVRFAYIDHYCSEREPLPVVLDDVLVNFDPTHQALAVKTILDLASRQQVIYLTCHPSTRALFDQAGTPYQHVRLEKWKFVS